MKIRSLSTISVLMFLVGLCLLAIHSQLHDRGAWNAAMLGLNPTAGNSTTATFHIPHTDVYEIQLEVDKSPDSAHAKRLVDPEKPMPFEITWSISTQDNIVAHGDVSDYLFIAPGPRSRKAVWRRILLNVPFDRNQAHWASWGIRGSFTMARGVGQFTAKAGENYQLHVNVQQDYPELMKLNPHMVVRRSRRSWDTHYESLAPLAYAGLLCMTLAVFLRISGWTLSRLR